VEFRKQVQVDYDYCGESVGFFRFSPAMAQKLINTAERYISGGCLDEPHEEAIRDILLAEPQAFGFEEVTGLPWIEIDFPEDVIRARNEILPRLVPHRQGIL
jgi:choline kinase